MVAIDLAPKLVALARDRLPATLGQGSITLLAGDMLDPALGGFDHVVAMDSLIHYRAADMAAAVAGLAALGLGLGASERVASGFYISQMQQVMPR